MIRSYRCALRLTMLLDGRHFRLPIAEEDFEVLRRRSAEGVPFFVNCLSQLGRDFDSALVVGVIPDHGWVCKEASALPLFLYGVFNLVLHNDGSIRNDADIIAIQFLRQFLLLDSKEDLPPSAGAERAVAERFRDRQRKLKEMGPSWNRFEESVDYASKVLESAFADCDLRDIKPSHGPGAVFQRFDRSQKWDFSSWPVRALKRYPRHFYGAYDPLASYLGKSPGHHHAKARVVFVPKDFRGPRLISAEDVVNQYLQQGQMKKIVSHIGTALTRYSIDLNDQNKSREAARMAIEYNQVTVDFTDASDCIGALLVYRLFRYLPTMRRLLFATRTTKTILNGESIKLYSFAPMGSAVCFPVETLVFWSLAMAAGHENDPSWGKRRLAQSIRVFGDDVIIPGHWMASYRRLCEACGLVISTSKTCEITKFRESCGAEYFDGSDVAVTRNKGYHYTADTCIDEQLSLATLQRGLFLRGYRETACLLAAICDENAPLPRYPLRLFEEDCASRQILDLPFAGLLDDAPSFKGVKTRFHRGYQRTEAWLPVISRKMGSWDTGGEPRLLARLSGDSTERLPSRGFTAKLAWHCIPAMRGIESLHWM